MNAKRTLIALLFVCASFVPASGALAAEPAPSWQMTAVPLPTAFKPGEAKDEVLLAANNLGAKATEGKVTIKDTLPSGVSPTGFEARGDVTSTTPECEISAQVITCTTAEPIDPGRQLEVRIFVKVTPTAEGTLSNTASIEGGGTATVTTTTPIQISATPPPFGILPGFNTKLTEADGSQATLAGAHPYELSVNANFPTERLPGGALIAAGHLRDFNVDFPRGVVINPKATSVLCTEAQLITEEEPGCPPASVVGTITILGLEVEPRARTFALYNMVPPPGTAASLGLDAYGIGIFIHVSGGVRNDGDYGITGESKDILALTNHPVFGVRVELWGDPTAKEHDAVRGRCALSESRGTCSTSETHTDMLAAPVDCLGAGPVSRARADSWEETGVFSEASDESPALTKCDQLEFKPAVAVKPTTNLTDSPSGLDVSVKQPQNFKFAGRAESVLKDIRLSLPEGLVINPSRAGGQSACSPSQIGLATAVGQTPIRFTKPPAQCPDAAKIGSVTVSSPLVAQVNANNEVERNPDGSAIPEPLPGSLYLAKPFANPFGTLLAAYLTVDDPKTGIVAKLAGEIHADPVTGQLFEHFHRIPTTADRRSRRPHLRRPPRSASHPTRLRHLHHPSPAHPLERSRHPGRHPQRPLRAE